MIKDLFKSKPKTIVAVTIATILLFSLLGFYLLTPTKTSKSSSQSAPESPNPPVASVKPDKSTQQNLVTDDTIKPLEITPQTKSEIRETFENVRTNLKDNIAPGTQALAGESDVNKIFPPGSRIEILENTWTQVEENIVYVQVIFHRPGAEPHPYTAIVVKLQDKWKIVATLESQGNTGGANPSGSTSSDTTPEDIQPITVEEPKKR